MGSVFISYRRDDSRDVCRVLAGALMARLGRRNVFLDVDSIAGGELFPRRLEEALRASVVVLVVIGPRWLTAADDHGLRRLDNPADFVRREIELALDSGATVLPLLVHGAAQPAAHDLPPSLQPLAALTPLALHDDPAGAPDLASAIRIIRRAALEADLRRLPRVASPPRRSSPACPTSRARRRATTGSGQARPRSTTMPPASPAGRPSSLSY